MRPRTAWSDCQDELRSAGWQQPQQEQQEHIVLLIRMIRMFNLAVLLLRMRSFRMPLISELVGRGLHTAQSENL